MDDRTLKIIHERDRRSRRNCQGRLVINVYRTTPPAMAQRKSLIVGGGITGAAVARLLQDAKGARHFAGEVVVWEKNNIAGGRMMARSFRKNRDIHVDVGAQYITKFTNANDDIRELLFREALLTKFDESHIAQDPARPPSVHTDHAVARSPLGYRSMVEHLLQGADVHLSREVDRFEVLDESRVKIVATDSHEEVVNELVLTCPIPNLLSILKKSAFDVDPRQLKALQQVQYSQRFAVAVLYDEGIKEQVRSLGWTSKYVAKSEDDIVRYLCWDNMKKQQDPDGVALLVHTGVPFGVEHMDGDNAHILETIMVSVKKLLPFLPAPQETLLHRWRMSQVTKSYADIEGPATPPSITLSASPRIVLAGDAILGSVFDNCILSAKHAANTIVDQQTVTSGL